MGDSGWDRHKTRRIAVLGATGSIGRGTLDVVAASHGWLHIAVVAVHRQTAKLAAALEELTVRKALLPECVIVTDPTADLTLLNPWRSRLEIRVGTDALDATIRNNDFGCSLVVSAIVGIAGLASTRAAIEAGLPVALANKESLVVGGSLLTALASQRGASLIPIDSEHSGVLQCLQAARFGSDNKDNRDSGVVEKVVLTASGGPFRTKTASELRSVTVADALAHPTWQMGPKVTVDSATLMNKALELIEARWLFGLETSRLSAVLHPQSIIHALVEFVDGSVVAQMSPPDMRLPIQLALTYPHRTASPAQRFDWSRGTTLELLPIDLKRFTAVALGLEVAAAGGTAGVVLNAANEIAVEAFLAGRLPFYQIVTAVDAVLRSHHHETAPTWAQLETLDHWARKETLEWISRLGLL